VSDLLAAFSLPLRIRWHTALVLTTKEVAERLKVSPKTVRRWVDAGKLKVRRMGYRTLRFRLADIVKFEEGR